MESADWADYSDNSGFGPDLPVEGGGAEGRKERRQREVVKIWMYLQGLAGRIHCWIGYVVFKKTERI